MSARLPPVPNSLLDEATGVLAGLPSELRRDPVVASRLLRLFAASPFAAKIATRHPQLLRELLDSGRLERCSEVGELAALVAAAVGRDLDEASFMSRLRLLRHRELLRVLWRELEDHSSVTETLADLSGLADACINAALDWAKEALWPRHGRPRLADGAPCDIGVIAMGKLGGFELNFSSDVDLVFVYADSGMTDGSRKIGNDEYFSLLCQRVVHLLAHPTTEGFVYRVDLRLRPFGNSGALALTLPALENYLMRSGRDWERYAYIKARVINPWSETAWFYREVVRPFVYRRYLDYGVFAALRDMKGLIEHEVQRDEFRDDIKLGPGGIREIEFIVQSIQLVRGGSVAALRSQQILRLFPVLSAQGFLASEAVDELAAAYLFLRRLENALQALNDQQLHQLPVDGQSQTRLALLLGLGSWAGLYELLQQHRARVTRHFRAVVFRGEQDAAAEGNPGLRHIWLGKMDRDAAMQHLREAGFMDPAPIFDRLQDMQAVSSLQRLDAAGRKRLDLLMPTLLEVAGRQPDAALAFSGTASVIEAIGRRSTYFALLNENPAARERLVRMCGLSDFLARQVAEYPLLLDELLDPRLFAEPPTRAELAGELHRRLEAVDGEDRERWLEALRNFQQAAIFRIAVADLSGVLPLMKVSDRLSETAELVLEAACGRAWMELSARHGVPRCTVDGRRRAAAFGVIAYGKLGGLELGYASDLDLVFLHDSEGEQQQTDGEQVLDNSRFFVRLAQRIISFVTILTPAGHLYEVDTRLQPEGRRGLLVSGLVAFSAYQCEKAWTWEHQALLRSRGIAGDKGVLSAFEAIREEVLTRHVHRDRLRADVLEMRERMSREHPPDGVDGFDLKHGRGGIMDIEFIVQYLVLREAGEKPSLLRWPDNIRQLDALARAAVIDTGTAAILADDYRLLRQKLHHLTLAGSDGVSSAADLEAASQRVRRIWSEVFTV